MNQRRKWLTGVLLGLLAGVAIAQGAGLPAVNLRVEWRWIEVSQGAQRGVAAEGAFQVGTEGVVDARGQLSLRTRSTRADSEAVQQLLVLNGGRAAIRLARAQPVPWLELASTPRGPSAVIGQRMIEQVTGLEVQARWPGPGAAVEVDLLADSPAPGALQGTDQLSTRLLLPAGEWFTVARSGGQRTRSEAGVLSSRDVERSSERQLQLRVSPP
jgi:hypothetical protein